MSRQQPAATGAWGSVVWAVEKSGKRRAQEFFDGLTDHDAAKVQALFEKWADHGRIHNERRFKKLGDRRGHAIWQFKEHQLRFLGSIVGRQFIVAVGLRKKQDKHRPRDLDAAARIVGEHLASNG